MKKKEKLIRLIKITLVLLSSLLFMRLTIRTARFIEVNDKSFAVLAGVLMGTGTLSFIMSIRKGTEGFADIFAVLFSASMAYYAIPLISIERFSLFPVDLKLNPAMHWYGFLTVLTVYLVIFALVGNAKTAAIFGNAGFTIFALVNNLCYTFRERPLCYADLGVWKEALNIAGEGYAPDFSEKEYYGIALMVAAAALIIFVMLIAKSLREDTVSKKRDIIGKRAFSPNVLLCRVLSLAVAFFLFNTIYSGNFLKERQINKSFLGVSTVRESPFLDFCCSIKNMMLEKPENYAPEDIYTKQGPRHDSKKMNTGAKPNIIVVMNEAFSDIKDMLPVDTNINPYYFFDWFKTRTRWGKLLVCDYGGNTANTEFQFLTGCDTAFFPEGVVPYNWYIQSEFPSLFSTLKAQGYNTLTVHPYLSSFWNREKVYKYYGVDKSYWDTDFINPTKTRGFISDSEDYAFLIERFKEKEPDKPIFIYNITMQNHGPYTYDMKPSVKVSQDASRDELEQYLSLIKITGEATAKLMEFFRTVKEPTIILFFGDHKPSIYSSFLEEHEKLWKGEREESHKVEIRSNKYMTEYYIWANFNFEPGRAEDISVNYLQGELLEFAGLEAPAFINFQQETLRKKWPVIVKSGCRRGDGAWFEFGVPELWEDEDIKKYYAMQYNLISDIRKMRTDIFYLYRN